jgi:AraC-like DNA-binding protein
MKPIHYNVPVPKDRTLFVQEDILERFYPHMHRHEEYQLIWIVEGTGQLLVEDSLHNFKKDDIFLLGSNQPHVFKNEQVGGFARSVSVFFNVKGRLAGMLDLPELGVLLDFISNNQRGFRVPNIYLNQVRRRIEILKKSDHMDQLINFFYLLKALNSVSAQLKPLSGASFVENEPNTTIRINKLCRYIDEHFKDNIALSEVAEQAHLTPQAFCRFFKKSTGKTFVSYLNDIRVREACRLLGTGTCDCISTVAYLCGFNSITNFNRVFRNVIGESPKEYMNKYITLLYQ